MDSVELGRYIEEYLKANSQYYLNENYKITLLLPDNNAGKSVFSLSNFYFDNGEYVHDKFISLSIYLENGINLSTDDGEYLSDIKYLSLWNEKYDYLLTNLNKIFPSLKYLKVNKCILDVETIRKMYPGIELFE